jgi:hypothetical protein
MRDKNHDNANKRMTGEHVPGGHAADDSPMPPDDSNPIAASPRKEDLGTGNARTSPGLSSAPGLSATTSEPACWPRLPGRDGDRG